MKLLIILSLFLLCWAVVLPFPHPGHIVNCDDPEVHEAANSIVQHINSKRYTGYKFALNRVEKAKVFPSASGAIYYLELDLLETVCPSVSTSVNCVVRPLIEQAVEGDCDAKVQKQNGNFTVLGVKCKSEPDSVENIIRVCPTCSFLAQLNDNQVVHAADVSLQKFNGGNNTVFYLLHEIGRGKIQSGISNIVHVEFVIAASNCSIADASSGLYACVKETGAGAHFGGCSASVVKNQGALDEEVAVQCSLFEAQPGAVAQALAPQVPLVPSQTNVVQSLFHHNLYDPSMGPHSFESNSGEQQLLAAHAARAVKRSLTGQPVPPNVASQPLCPGRKIHF